MHNEYQGNWPIVGDLKGIYSDESKFKPFIVGYLVSMSKKIGNPVIFIYYNEEDENEYPIIDDVRTLSYVETDDNESIIEERDPVHTCKLCKEFRNNMFFDDSNILKEGRVLCYEADKKAAKEFLTQYASSNGKSFGRFEVSDKREAECYTYKCDCLGLTEYIAPVLLFGKCIGCFITGQFGEAHPNAKYLEWYNDLSLSGKVTYDKPDTEKLYEFKNAVNEVCNRIYQDYKAIELLYIHDIRRELLNTVWGVYDELNNNIKEETNILNTISIKLERVSNNFIKSVEEFMRYFMITSLILFKPDTDPINVDDLQGSFMLSGEYKCEPIADGLSIMKLRRYISKHKKNDHFIVLCPDNHSEPNQNEVLIRLLSKNNAALTEIPNKLILMVCYMDDFPDALVACLFTSEYTNYYVGEQGKGATSPTEVFERIGTAFLAQWNSLIAKRSKLIYKSTSEYYDHELGLTHAGVNNVLASLTREFQMAIQYRNNDILYAYPELPRQISSFLFSTRDNIKNLQVYNDLLSFVIGRSIVWDTTKDLEKLYFLPYGDLLYTIYGALKSDLSNKRQILVRPKAEEVENNLRKYPGIVGNRPALMQAISNLMRNANKYGYNNTKIYLYGQAAKGIDGRDGFEFIVTSYGIPILKDEVDNIFHLGFRGKYAIDTDEQTSIGFGLYIVDVVAKQHDGILELVENEVLSDKCLPLLRLFTNIDFSNFDKSTRIKMELLQDECRAESNKERDCTFWSDMIAIPMQKNDIKQENVFSPLYFINRINQPTAKVTFRLWIPLRYGSN